MHRSVAAATDRSREELPHAQGKGRRPRAPGCDGTGVAKRSYPTSKEQWLRGHRRTERSYSTFKVRRGDLVQGKEQRLRFAGAAVKKYPTSKVRKTQEDGRCCKRALEGRHTETIITEN